DEALDKFKVFKTEVELQQGSLIKRFKTDRGGEYMDPLYFQSVGIIHEMTSPYTLQQNDISERKNRVPNKRNMITLYELWTKSKPNLNYLRVLGCREFVRLPDPKLKTLGERGIECIFVGYAEHSKAFRFYVIEPNDSVAINSIIESMDAIFDENKFSSVPRPSQRSLVKGTKDSGGSVVPEKATDEVVQQHEPELRKGKRHRTPKDFGPEFQLYLIKEAINNEMDSIMGNNTWVLTDLPPVARISTIRLLIAKASIHSLIIHQMDVKTAFLNGELKEEVYLNQPYGFIMPSNESKVDLTKEFLSSRFFMKDMGEADVILVSTHMDTSEKLMHNNGQAASKLEYSRVIDCLMYDMTCTRLNIAFAMGKLSRLTYTGYPSVLEGYTDASWISNTEDNSSTSGWVFMLDGGVIFWAFKKQTCIIGSTIEYEFMALATAGKEAEWLKNLLFEILLWVKPMAPISIRCNSAATLAKAYSQMYNEKSRHLGARHNMIRELITNGVVIEHPDSDSGKREFKPVIDFSELTLHIFAVMILDGDVRRFGFDVADEHEEDSTKLLVHRCLIDTSNIRLSVLHARWLIKLLKCCKSFFIGATVVLCAAAGVPPEIQIRLIFVGLAVVSVDLEYYSHELQKNFVFVDYVHAEIE
ncbi:zinc finger, CCHC-type containing protein, partial [Tanacetum coccineum]